MALVGTGVTWSDWGAAPAACGQTPPTAPAAQVLASAQRWSALGIWITWDAQGKIHVLAPATLIITLEMCIQKQQVFHVGFLTRTSFSCLILLISIGALYEFLGAVMGKWTLKREFKVFLQRHNEVFLPSYPKARLCFVCLEKRLVKSFRCIRYLLAQNLGLSCEIKVNLALLFLFLI